MEQDKKIAELRNRLAQQTAQTPSLPPWQTATQPTPLLPQEQHLGDVSTADFFNRLEKDLEATAAQPTPATISAPQAAVNTTSTPTAAVPNNTTAANTLGPKDPRKANPRRRSASPKPRPSTTKKNPHHYIPKDKDVVRMPDWISDEVVRAIRSSQSFPGQSVQWSQIGTALRRGPTAKTPYKFKEMMEYAAWRGAIEIGLGSVPGSNRWARLVVRKRSPPRRPTSPPRTKQPSPQRTPSPSPEGPLLDLNDAPPDTVEESNKTEICKYFLTGFCWNGTKCRYKHVRPEKEPKIERYQPSSF